MHEAGNSTNKKSVYDVLKFQDESVGMQYGLWQDAQSNWSSVFGSASVLSDPEELAVLSAENKEFYKKMLYKRMSLYREYLERAYSPDAVDAILQHQGSDPEKIAQHDAIVAQFNTALAQETLTPEQALTFYDQAIMLFDE